jgi:hypothetical protein
MITEHPLKTKTLPDSEALIREARRRQRRRWAIATFSVTALLGAVAAIVALAMPSTEARSGARASASPEVLPNGPLATLHNAGPLAVAPDGALYIADDPSNAQPSADRVLVRLRDGRFRVVAGTEKRGFSGDGGPAVRAELSDVTDLAVGPDGTLYIADGGRVRTVSRDGVIRTIAGSGRPPSTIANGTPALSAPLGRLFIALGPAGQLYISTGSPWPSPASQILRLTTAGTLDPIRAIVTSAPGGNLTDRAARGSQLSAFDHIAVDAQGNIDVAGGPGGWGVWQIAPDGNAHLASGDRYAHGNGGADPTLERGPGGAVYAAAGSPGIFRVEPYKLVPIAAFNGPLARPVHGESVLPLRFAFSPSGTLYADDEPGGTAFEAHQQLVSVSNGHPSLLWQQHNITHK